MKTEMQLLLQTLNTYYASVAKKNMSRDLGSQTYYVNLLNGTYQYLCVNTGITIWFKC